MKICPYDVMGTWVNDYHILSARAKPVPVFQCLCEVFINKSSQVRSFSTFYRFYEVRRVRFTAYLSGMTLDLKADKFPVNYDFAYR